MAVFHLSETSGPSKTLYPSLERLAESGPLEVIVPLPGGAPLPGTVARSYQALATVTPMPYVPLTVPRSVRAAIGLPLRFTREFRAFREHIRRTQPDLAVIATGVLPAALMAARLEGIPTIVRVAEIFEKGYVHGPARSVGARAVVLLLRMLSDAIVCSSDAVAAQFGPSGSPLVETICPGIDPYHGEGDTQKVRTEFALGNAHPMVAVVGNVTHARGQDLTIRAMPKILESHPDAHLLLAGAPHARPVDIAFERRLQGLAKSLGVESHVTFAGFVENVADVYAAADILVNPARFNEPFGRVALEGLVANVPVVAARIGAIPEVLRNGEDSLLVPAEDPGAISAAVIKLADDPDMAAQLATNGRARVLREFGMKRVADDFERIASAITNNARPSS
jgi:glycosyltransferase involved in cell wall biosynthesis